MTYNFDPDRWFDIELSSLEAKQIQGCLTPEQFEKAHEKLVDEYEKMLERLQIEHAY